MRKKVQLQMAQLYDSLGRSQDDVSGLERRLVACSVWIHPRSFQRDLHVGERALEA